MRETVQIHPSQFFVIQVWFFVLLASRWIAAQDPAPNVIDALAGLKTQLNTVNSTADLTCESSRMMVNLTFAQAFVGKVFAENNPSDTRCWLIGDGRKSYQYPVPLKQCGTRQINLREFENTLQIRFGNTDVIELGDERKTILCRYPPPVVPPILPIPPPIAGAIPPVPAASVSELELLLIIAAVLFLGLLLLGLCCAWWCCKRRRAAKVVESEGILIEEPDVMKLSGTTVPFLIPRAAASGSDASESALITRLEESASGSGEFPPIVPQASTEVIRIPHVTQMSKGYELQEASMNVPASIAPGSEVAEGEYETKETVIDRETEHTAIFAPPIPLRPPSPLLQRYIPPPAPFYQEDYERETVSDLTETDIEHTLIAGRIPRRPPSPVRSEPYDMRSVSVLSEESITRQSVIPMPPPVLPPAMKSVLTEMETETHSVVESLENELILRAVPKRQPRLMPSQQPYYPLDTRTETSVVTERLERVYPAPMAPSTTSTREDHQSRTDVRRRQEPNPETTTTRTVKETNISRDFEIYPEQRQPSYPPQTTSTTTRTSSDDRTQYGRYPPQPSSQGPLKTTTRMTRETDIQRDYELRPPPVRPSTTTRTTTETDVERDYEIVRPPPMQPPSSTNITRTTKETDIRRDFEIYPGQRYPSDQPLTTTTVTRTREDNLSPERPFSPEFVDTTITNVTERNVTRDFEVYPRGPTFQPPREPYTDVSEFTSRRIERNPFGLPEPETTTSTRLHRETNIRRDYDYRGMPPRDGSMSPDYPVSTTRTTDLDHRQHRGVGYLPEDVDREEQSTYITTTTRDIQKQIDVGTPPEGSGHGSETSNENAPLTSSRRKTEFRREYSIDAPTTIPRPLLREPYSTTITTTTASGRHLSGTNMTSYAEATPSYQPFTQDLPVMETRRQSSRSPVDWDDVYHVIYETHSDNACPISESLPPKDIQRLRELIIYDNEFQLSLTRVRTVYDLYYIRYTAPYDSFFTQTSWTVIIRIFVVVLELPRPHPEDGDFIEPQPEWFSRPLGFGSRDRSDSSSTGTTLTPSYAERALSELTEDIPRMAPRGSSERSEESDTGSSWFGSVARRASTEYSVSERSVAEYLEDVPTLAAASRMHRGQRNTRVGPVWETEEPVSEL